jgi:hypothetical protein
VTTLSAKCIQTKSNNLLKLDLMHVILTRTKHVYILFFLTFSYHKTKLLYLGGGENFKVSEI